MAWISIRRNCRLFDDGTAINKVVRELVLQIIKIQENTTAGYFLEKQQQLACRLCESLEQGVLYGLEDPAR